MSNDLKVGYEKTKKDYVDKYGAIPKKSKKGKEEKGKKSTPKKKGK